MLIYQRVISVHWCGMFFNYFSVKYPALFTSRTIEHGASPRIQCVRVLFPSATNPHPEFCLHLLHLIIDECSVSASKYKPKMQRLQSFQMMCNWNDLQIYTPLELLVKRHQIVPPPAMFVGLCLPTCNKIDFLRFCSPCHKSIPELHSSLPHIDPYSYVMLCG